MSIEHPRGTADNQDISPAGADAGDWRSGPLVGLALAMVGGAMTWGLVEYTSPIFEVPKKYHIPDLGAPAEKWNAYVAAQVKVDRQNAMLEFAYFGALVTGMIAVGDGIARRSLKPGLVAVPVGAAGGCAAGLFGSLAYQAFGIGPRADLADTVGVQAVTLGVLGIGVGLALGLSGKSLRNVVVSGVAGMLAGVLAGVLYPVAISLLMPTASTDSLIPKGEVTRMFWIGTSAGLLGLIVAGTARRRGWRTQPNT
jgi:hypothetical protein